jgi:hypothetical protein
MKKLTKFQLVWIASGFCLLATGCYVEGRGPAGEVYVASAPPALLVETEAPAPGPDFVWIGGDWFWEGGRWQWHGGHWARPPHPGAHFVANHYEFRGGRHVYVRGGWR